MSLRESLMELTIGVVSFVAIAVAKHCKRRSRSKRRGPKAHEIKTK